MALGKLNWSLALIGSACLSGCMGSGSTTYRGVVAGSTHPGYEFRQSAEGPQNPVQGAVVILLSSFEGASPCPQFSDVERLDSPTDDVTDRQGRFKVYTVFGGGPWTEIVLTLCVYHQHYETFRYTTPYTHPVDPHFGEKDMHIYLRRKRESGQKP